MIERQAAKTINQIQCSDVSRREDKSLREQAL
jgi:hypothetical protein